MEIGTEMATGIGSGNVNMHRVTMFESGIVFDNET